MTIRDLRNRGGAVIDGLGPGESVVVTRDGEPVAELRRANGRPLSTEELIARRRNLPSIDYGKMRAELDEIVDPWL